MADTKSPRIHLKVDQIPEVQRPMPVLKLESPVLPSEDRLAEMAKAVSPRASFRDMNNGAARAAYDGNRLVALANLKTGESRVFPSLESLKPGRQLAERAKAAAEGILGERELFPDDGTAMVPLAPVTLMGSRHSRGEQRTEPDEYLGYLRFQRQVDGVPVFGPGTRGMIAVAADDSVQSFAHRWRTTVPSGEQLEPRPRAEIAKAIVAQLGTSEKSADVKVDKVTLGYYDSGRDFLQPVYRFHATVASRPTKKHRLNPANRHVFGYVSLADPPEALPVLGAKQAKRPGPAKKAKPAEPPPPGDPTVGRYVVRNDTDEWVTSANEFLGGLMLARGLFGGPIPFTDSQYYWAEPRLFVSQKESFVDSVNIALNEVHGNWWYFTTRDNADDGVSLSSIPSTGYGGGAGGSLAYWIIHSCEVVPTQTDEATSFDVWWNIFNGLHAVVGYRTEMWIDDDVAGPFGFFIGLGAPVVPAWLSEVAGNDSYDDGDTYHDGNRDIDEPMGRASAVVVCGHTDDTAADVAPLPRPSCLTEWWFDN
jgi:hypothetical protein